MTQVEGPKTGEPAALSVGQRSYDNEAAFARTLRLRGSMERHQLESCPVIAETNISVLHVAGDKVYKTKLPRTFPFVDQKSLIDRQRLCHQEFVLNRRFSPNVYLGVEDITDGGELVDAAVVMKRMPAERSLTRLLGAGADVEECVKDVARQMAIYHQSAPRSAHINEAGSFGAVQELWRLSLQEMEAFAPSVLDPLVLSEVSTRSAEYLAGRHDLFEFRVGLGLIVDGHGDLLADDIYCLEDGPRLLDCLEFDERFRFGDVLLDLAFLAMDLKRLGHAPLANVFIDEYVDLAGEHHPTSLIHHYIAYRALVRCKVQCYRAQSGVVGAAQEASLLLALAANSLSLGEVRLIVIGGLPGTGKTTVAEMMSAHCSWTVLSSDAIRREIAGVPSGDQSYGEGSHDPAATKLTYDTLLRRAKAALSLGESVILDASFADETWRATARELAVKTKAVPVELCCVAPPAVANERISRRRRHAGPPQTLLSDATPAIAATMAEHFSLWPTAVVLDTTGSKPATLAKALSTFT